MPRFDPTEFGSMLACLTPQEMRQVEGPVADGSKRAEAILEIDARADAGSLKFVPVPGHWGTLALSTRGASHVTTTQNIHG